MADTGEDKAVKKDKFRRLVKLAERDHGAQRLILGLEPLLVVTNELNKGEGLVFDYGENVFDTSALLSTTTQKIHRCFF